MTNEEIRKLNIYEKLSLITDEMAVVEKKLSVQVTQNNSYKAVSERDILDNVKPLEFKYRVYSHPLHRAIISQDIISKETEYNGKITRTNSLYLRIEVTYRFINIDNPSEFIDVTSYADGIDTGDKATGKAMTYADKYALMKAYKISTGDDPDKDASPEHGYTVTQNPELVAELELLGGSLEIAKTIYKKKSINDVTNDEIKALIERKKKQLANKGGK